MSRYDEIASVAVPRMEEFFAERELVSRLAGQLVAAYCAFLDAPQDAGSFMALDGWRKPIGDREASIEKAPPVQERDGSWSFCFAMKFEKPGSPCFSIERRKINVRVKSGAVLVSCGREFVIETKDEFDFKELFEYFFEDTKHSYRHRREIQRIGFFADD